MAGSTLGMRRLALCAALALAAWLAPPATANAQNKTEVDLALVLAVDVSGSINEARWNMERQGYAEAFRSDEVIRAITKGPIGSIAVTLVQWANPNEQGTVIGWTLVNDAASAGKLADTLAGMPRIYRGRTSISSGILYSAELLKQAPYEASRKVIDVSGDGPDNTSTAYGYEGYNPYSMGSASDTEGLRRIRDETIKAGIVINGLPIFGDPRAGQLDEYYRQNVIGGPGSFLIVAKDFQSFATAVRRKLVLEIGEAPVDRGHTEFAAVR